MLAKRVHAGVARRGSIRGSVVVLLVLGFGLSATSAAHAEPWGKPFTFGSFLPSADAESAQTARAAEEADTTTRSGDLMVDPSDGRDPRDEDLRRPSLLSEKAKWVEEKTWDGFITGLRDGFEYFPRPIGSPLYFEDPFINTDLRPLLLYHEFPKGSLLGGGHLMVQAVQARVALTERLQFIATADGYADLEAKALPAGDGYNDLAAGLKYAFYVDRETMSIMSAGVRWRLSNGSRDVFQGIEDEISVFLTGARKFGKLHVIADVVGRLTTHGSQGNDSVSWDVNASYELLPHFYPLVEYHGFVYTSNGKRLPTARDGLLDYGNLGAGDVRNSMAHWATFGFRWNLMPDVSFGAGYGVSLGSADKNDIFDERLTVNMIFTF